MTKVAVMLFSNNVIQSSESWTEVPIHRL